jgi:hypothetical protein
LKSTLHELTALTLGDDNEDSREDGSITHNIPDRLKVKLNAQREHLSRLLKRLPLEGKRRQLGEALRRFTPQRPRIPAIPSSPRESLQSAKRRVQHQVQHSTKRVAELTEYWKAQREKPTIVRLFDKAAFLFGVLTLVGSEFILLSHPSYFWAW